MKVQQKTTETKSTPKLAFFPFFPRKLCHETINPWCSQRALTRGMDSTWELVNGAGSRHTPSQIYWIRTSILTKSRAEPNTHQGMRNTALEEFWWSCSRWGDDKESSPTSRTQVFRLWTTWMPIIRGVCFKKKNAYSWVPIPDSESERPTLMQSCSLLLSQHCRTASRVHPLLGRYGLLLIHC